MTGEMLADIDGDLHAANVDLKSFSDDFYRTLVGARLKPVLDSIRRLREMGVWVEVTTLLIPGRNDGEDELRGAGRVPGLGLARHPLARLALPPHLPPARRSADAGRHRGEGASASGARRGCATCTGATSPVTRRSRRSARRAGRWCWSGRGFTALRKDRTAGGTLSRIAGIARSPAGTEEGGSSMSSCRMFRHSPSSHHHPRGGRGRACAEARATVRAMTAAAGEGGRARPRHHRPALAAQPPGPQPDGRLAGRVVQGLPGLLPGAPGAGGGRRRRGAGRGHHGAGRPRMASR